MQAALIEIIDRLDELDDSNAYDPLSIFAEGGSKATALAKAIVCPADEDGSRICPLDHAFTEVLMVQQAKECIDVWSNWRGSLQPSKQDKFEAVMYYSRHDAWLPAD